MSDANEMHELREDIRVLRGLIDVAVERGAVEDYFLQACAHTLRERCERLGQLEQAGCTK